MKDMFVYNNYVSAGYDDALEAEGEDINAAYWGNVLVNPWPSGTSFCRMAIGLSPVAVGPLYIFRNTLIRFGDATLKYGNSSTGRQYFYHNTIYGSGPATYGNNNQLGNVVWRNNIMHSMGRHPALYLSGPMGVGSTEFFSSNDFDYDLFWQNDVHLAVRWNYYQGQTGALYDGATSTTDLHAGLDPWTDDTGQEVHGINAEPLFVDPASNDLRLQSASPAIDRGTVIIGINDQNSPWPYGGSAPDMGAYEYDSGPVTNRPPVLNPIGNRTVNEGEPLQFTISATDPDGGTLTYSASNLPSGASFNAGSRTFSWTPGTGQAGTYSNVRFEVTDGSLTDSENITITVTTPGANQPPVLNPIGNMTVDEGELLQFAISATDPDGDTLTYSASNLPSGASFDTQTQTFSWTPGTGQAGTYSNVHFEVTDGSLTDSEDITITVASSGSQPSLPLGVNAGGDVYTDSSGNSWQADQAYSTGSWGFYGPDNSFDRGADYAIGGTVDDRIYQTIRYGLSGYRFDLANGIYTVTLHFAETYSTDPGQRVFDVSIEGQLLLDDLDVFLEIGGSTALEKVFSGIVVQDGQLNIDFSASTYLPLINGIEILSTRPNNPPALNPIGNETVAEGSLLQFTISATDPDGDTMTYSASNLPSGASFNAGSRTFSWTPNSGQAGTYPNVHFEVTDGSLTDAEDISITVTVNQTYQDWDVNLDGNVDILDMISVGQHWDEVGAAGWIPEDVNNDGTVNILDMTIIGQHWTG
jgi:hypothetical protein